jgi:Tfp pilus assembly protein PilW
MTDMKYLKNNQGISLIELLIGAIISCVIVTSALSLYVTQHKHMVVQSQVSDMQLNARAAIQELANKIRMAGFGVPEGIEAVRASNTNPDTIVILFDNADLSGIITNQAMANPSSELRCDGDISSLQAGNWLYIYDPTTKTGEAFLVSDVQSGAGRIQHTTMPLSRSYPVGSRVISMSINKYYVDNLTDPSHPAMMLANTGQAAQIYADNITDLQFRYVLSSGAIVDVPSMAGMIREIIIIVTARTETADRDLDNSYRTRNLQTRVKVRNLGIG